MHDFTPTLDAHSNGHANPACEHRVPTVDEIRAAIHRISPIRVNETWTSYNGRCTDAVAALFSQPTPDPEPEVCVWCKHPSDGHHPRGEGRRPGCERCGCDAVPFAAPASPPVPEPERPYRAAKAAADALIEAADGPADVLRILAFAIERAEAER